jgi:hypothetical protein
MLGTAIVMGALAAAGDAPAQDTIPSKPGADALVVAPAAALAAAKPPGKPKNGHKVKGSVEFQYRTNTNIGAAPSSGNAFDFADFDEFGEDEFEEDVGFDDDPFDDLEDVDPDEDEIEEDDGLDEDGDGIDDLIDPNADTSVDEEERYTTKFGLNHLYKFADGEKAWSNAIRLASDQHADREDLDKFNWAVTTGLQFSPSESKHQFKTALSYVTLEKDNDKFSSTFVVSLAYEYEVSKSLALSAVYNYQDKDITDPENPDARIDTLALSADFKATENDIFKVKFAPKVEDSTEVTRNTDDYGWELTYTRKLPWDMTLGLGYRFESTDYKNLTPRREDDDTSYAIQLAKDFGKHFTAAMGYETKDRESNIPSKNTENDSIYIEGTYKF